MATIAYDGEDIVIRGAKASHFGDITDAEDNGVGKWGFDYRSRADFPGLALPAIVIATFHLEQFHPCKCYHPHNGRTIFCFLIDQGPARRTGRDADLLVKPWTYFGYDLSDSAPDDILIDIRIYDPPNKPKIH